MFMNKEKKAVTDLVFHYTTKETALEKILHDLDIKMGSYFRTNDPKESNYWNPMTSGSGLNRGVFSELSSRAREEITKAQENALIICMTKDSESIDESLEKRGFGHSRMWAQYGGNHTGVCLVFDSKKLTELVKKAKPLSGYLFSGSVKYLDLISDDFSNDPNAYEININKFENNNPREATLSHVTEYVDTLFFKKSLDWESEREFRWVYIGSENQDEVFIPISEALEEIVLGDNFPHLVYEPLLRKIKDNLNVKISKIHFRKGLFEYNDNIYKTYS